MTITIGFIGCGNMGSALAKGILNNPVLKREFAVIAFDIDAGRRALLATEGATEAASPAELAEKADYILLAVKPYQVSETIAAVFPALTTKKTLLSIAAGVPLSSLRAFVQGRCPCVQIMPNTPAMVGEGQFALCLEDPELPEERAAALSRLFEGLGTVFSIPENKMNAFSAVAGCGPAYVFDLMDALMEAAITLGFTRPQATDMVGNLFRGSARLMLESGEHPAVLHSQVTSPGGQTIVGTNHLARTAVRGNIIDAVLAAYAKGREMEGK